MRRMQIQVSIRHGPRYTRGYLRLSYQGVSLISDALDALTGL